MHITFDCPNGHPLRLKAEFAGKKAKCPKCGAVTVVHRAGKPADGRRRLLWIGGGAVAGIAVVAGISWLVYFRAGQKPNTTPTDAENMKARRMDCGVTTVVQLASADKIKEVEAPKATPIVPPAVERRAASIRNWDKMA